MIYDTQLNLHDVFSSVSQEGHLSFLLFAFIVNIVKCLRNSTIFIFDVKHLMQLRPAVATHMTIYDYVTKLRESR